MAGGSSSYHDEEPGSDAITAINVTPLVDITLVLLIIFMVTARLIVARGIEVESPKTVAGGPVPSTLEITIRPGPQWYLGTRLVTDKQEIVAAVTQRLAQDKQFRPIITADRRVPHGDVMEIVDLLKGAKVKRFALTTEVKQKE